MPTLRRKSSECGVRRPYNTQRDGCGLAREKVRMRRGPGLTAAAQRSLVTMPRNGNGRRRVAGGAVTRWPAVPATGT